MHKPLTVESFPGRSKITNESGSIVLVKSVNGVVLDPPFELLPGASITVECLLQR